MKTAKCVNDSLNPRLDSLRENELQVRIMGEDEDLDVGEEIFAEAEKRGECRVGEYSRRLNIKGTDLYHREFVTVEIDEKKMEED